MQQQQHHHHIIHINLFIELCWSNCRVERAHRKFDLFGGKRVVVTLHARSSNPFTHGSSEINNIVNTVQLQHHYFFFVALSIYNWPACAQVHLCTIVHVDAVCRTQNLNLKKKIEQQQQSPHLNELFVHLHFSLIRFCVCFFARACMLFTS